MVINMPKDAKILYDKNEDMLYVYSGKHPKFSLEVNNLVLDISSRGQVVGIEILDASKFLGISKKMLAAIKEAKISSISRGMYLFVRVVMVMADSREVITPIVVPLAREEIKKEALAVA